MMLKQSDKLVSANFRNGKVVWESPSNIAIIKYWGKKKRQIPKNPSISFSLDKSRTKTTIEYSRKAIESLKPTINFTFEGKINTVFESRVELFISNILPYFPFLSGLQLTIQSENTFPHSAGIASSASGLSSIALCLCSIEKKLLGTLKNEDEFYKKASFISRLGSGSASRSVFKGWALWGESGFIKASSNEYAIPITNIHPVFTKIRDAVLLVDSGKKLISSSQGHEMMDNHIFSASRIKQANKNCIDLYEVLQHGDVSKFIEITENEALTLHALMMSSTPGYLLLRPGSIRIIEKIWEFRKETKLPVGFTIDAGPNIHLLYFSRDRKQVHDLIKSELLDYCENRQWIDDGIGEGPVNMVSE